MIEKEVKTRHLFMFPLMINFIALSCNDDSKSGHDRSDNSGKQMFYLHYISEGSVSHINGIRPSSL